LRASSVRDQSLDITTVACVLVRKSKCVGTRSRGRPQGERDRRTLLMARNCRIPPTSAIRRIGLVRLAPSIGGYPP
jgi:hypothetical protein